MPYQLSRDLWVDQQVLRVEGILIQNMVLGQDYTVEEVLALLHDYGLDYSNPAYQEIGAKLIAQGILVVV